MYRIIVIGVWLFGIIWSHAAGAQEPSVHTSGDIFKAIQKLRVLGSVLYIAAHPDDENTRLISHFANDLNMHTTYLSMTRGDGGQNLIGSEINELLGVIRTQELLQARAIDNGHQRFTRANDFGYSKTPDETLTIWNEKEILGDVVWAMRMIQPDIVVNRFAEAPSNGNHGHHTASAILSSRAFDISSSAQQYPEQLGQVNVWKPARLFLNTTWWFYGSREKFEQADKSNMVTVDIGHYDPVTGTSNAEIAARSRSMHKSQGFGATGMRGSDLEYLDLLKGSLPNESTDVFEEIDISWNRVPNAGYIDNMLEAIESGFDFRKPYLSVPHLLAVRREIARLDNVSVWKQRKLAEVEDVIVSALGLFVEADASAYNVVPGDSVSVNFEVINRSPLAVRLLSSEFVTGKQDILWNEALDFNKRFTAMRRVRIPEDQPYTTPYWLNSAHTIGMYTVGRQALRGLPETPDRVMTRFMVRVFDDTIAVEVPVVYKETDPVKGEVYRPFEIVPPVFVNFESPVYLFPDTQQRTVTVIVKTARNSVEGEVSLSAPAGWNIHPKTIPLSLENAGAESAFGFTLSPATDAENGLLSAAVTVGGQICDRMISRVNYDHIPIQTVLRPAQARVVFTDLETQGRVVAYIHGAGDEIATSLQQIGYSVEILSAEDVTNAETLRPYSAVILGIRAYNTIDRLKFIQEHLFRYVENGGTLITQYNTAHNTVADRLAPVSLRIGRGRVTDEHSSVSILDPKHPAMTTPNQITSSDFEGWIQERGLYFADSWDPALEPLLSMADPGEEPQTGSLLVGRYGKGYFVYTSLSFFRQLPEGVPGAYRLFANLLALGQNGKS